MRTASPSPQDGTPTRPGVCGFRFCEGGSDTHYVVRAERTETSFRVATTTHTRGMFCWWESVSDRKYRKSVREAVALAEGRAKTLTADDQQVILVVPEFVQPWEINVQPGS